jgi:hypothetical protein
MGGKKGGEVFTKATNRLTKLYERFAGGTEVADQVSYGALPREDKTRFVRLFGGRPNINESVLHVQRVLIHG